MAALLYGDAMREAIVSGNLAKMKRVASLAEKKLQKEGDIATALQVLRVEIGRLETKVRKPRLKSRRR